MKKLLLCWKGPVGLLHVQLGRKLVLELSQQLVFCAAYCPVEFAHKPRTLDGVNWWNATKFREFILVLWAISCGILPDELLKHFMLLYVGMRILASRQLAVVHSDFANGLLVKFGVMLKYCGKQIMVYNVHCLIHLAANVKHFGCLDNFSAFPFENKLGQWKKLI